MSGSPLSTPRTATVQRQPAQQQRGPESSSSSGGGSGGNGGDRGAIPRAGSSRRLVTQAQAVAVAQEAAAQQAAVRVTARHNLFLLQPAAVLRGESEAGDTAVTAAPTHDDESGGGSSSGTGPDAAEDAALVSTRAARVLVLEYQAALSHVTNARRPGLWARCAQVYLAAGDFSGAVTIYNRLAVRVLHVLCSPVARC